MSKDNMSESKIANLRGLIDYYCPLIIDLSVFADKTGQQAAATRIASKIFKDFELKYNCLAENQEKRPRKLRKIFRARAAKLKAAELKEEQPDAKPSMQERTLPAEPAEEVVSVIVAKKAPEESEIYEYYLDIEYALKEEDPKGVRTEEERRTAAIDLVAQNFELNMKTTAEIIVRQEANAAEQEKAKENTDIGEAEERGKSKGDGDECEQSNAAVNKEVVAEHELPPNAIDSHFSAKKENQ